MIISRRILLRVRSVSENKKVLEKIQMHILCSSVFSPRKSRRLWDNVEKYGTAGQATDDNIAQAHCMLDNYGYRHTLRICIILLVHSNNCWMDAPQCYVTHTLFAFWNITTVSFMQNSRATHSALTSRVSAPEPCLYTSVRAPWVEDRPVILRPPHRKIRTQNHQAYTCLEWDSKPCSPSSQCSRLLPRSVHPIQTKKKCTNKWLCGQKTQLYMSN